MTEDGSGAAVELWDSPVRVVSSVLCYPEARAALAAAARDGRLTSADHRDARRELRVLHDELLVLEVDGELAHRAGELADERALRGYDAVHLASALAFGAETTVVSWDRDLRRAAERSGCAVAPAGLVA